MNVGTREIQLRFGVEGQQAVIEVSGSGVIGSPAIPSGFEHSLIAHLPLSLEPFLGLLMDK